MSVNPIPNDRQTVIPHLGVKGCAEAIEFYKHAFAAEEILARITDGEGRIGHAEIKIGDTVIYLADEHPEFGLMSPTSLGGSHVSFAIHVDDVDAMVARAVEAGAELVRPVADQFYGDRTGTIKDAYGYSWTLSTHVEDVSEDEMARRYAELESQQ